MIVIGVDPGPIPGFVRLDIATELGHGTLRDIAVLQASRSLAWWAFEMLARPSEPLQLDHAHVLAAMETFVVGPRAARSSTAHAGLQTREMVADLTERAGQLGVQILRRPAGQVKPWADDRRLGNAGILDACKGMRHARDAGRHALFAAVAGGYLPDPLGDHWRSDTDHREGSRS